MNVKSFVASGCVALLILSASAATAATRGGSFSGTSSRPSFGSRTTPSFNTGSRFGSRGFHNNNFFRHRHHHDDFFFFGGFFDPFFFPFGYSGFYPYGYYPYYGGSYPYGAPYGYGYGSGPYYGSGYSDVRSGGSVQETQIRLKRLGYYHGKIDGVMGPRTRAAIRAYQRDHAVARRY